MADTTLSPNMGMPVPNVGVAPGPDWATDINASLSVVDQHDHTAGKGVPITPDSLNINTDLPLNGNNLTLTKSVRFSAQTLPLSGGTDLGCIYEAGVDLYYNDGAGNQIRLTQSGAPAGATGTITGLPSGTASASFAGTTFTFQSATSTPASLNVGPVKIAQAVASGFGVTISPSGSQAADYTLSLPTALPASTKILTVDSSGNIGDVYDVDNVTLDISANLLEIKAGGVGTTQLATSAITTAKIADGSVTNVKLATANVSDSSASGAYSTASGTFVDVTNMTVTLATVGRPVLLSFRPSTSGGSISGQDSSGQVEYKILRDGGSISVAVLTSSGVPGGFASPPGCLNYIDNTPTAGSHTWKLQARAASGASTTAHVNNVIMQAWEL